MTKPTEPHDFELCENCNDPITGRVVRTADDYPLCVPCAEGLAPAPMPERFVRSVDVLERLK